MTNQHNLGQDLRALRKSRKKTLEELAKNLGKSLGWVSQVERGLSTPTMEDLRDFARVFGVPMSLFFGSTPGPHNEQGKIVRATARRHIETHDTGLMETLVSPDLTDDFEVIHSTFQPGAKVSENMTRPTTEVGYIISGTLDLWIADEKFTVSVGDSFRIRGDSFRWANPYGVAAVVLWVISPPVY